MLTIQKSTPEDVGVSSASILNFLKRLDDYRVPMHSVQLMRHDKLIYEGYYNPCKKGELHRMFSISKSLTSLAIGTLAAEGKLSLDDPIIQYFPQYNTRTLSPWITEMTIRNCLSMRTCHAKTTYKLDMTKDWVESFFITPPDHKPGTMFHYDTSAAHTMCALVENMTGKPLLTFLKDSFLREIGFSEESYMLTDPFGVSLGGSGLMATSEDMLRLGYLLAHRGSIDGKILMDPAYLDEALSSQSSTAVTGLILEESESYGYQFWRGEHNSFFCYGMGGQFIIYLPKEDLLCVTTADTQGLQGGNQLIFQSLFEEILPHLSELSNIDNPTEQDEKQDEKQNALTEQAQIQSALMEYTHNLEIRPLSYYRKTLDTSLSSSECILCTNDNVSEAKRTNMPAIAKAVSGKTFSIVDSSCPFTSLCLTFAENGEGILTYELSGAHCELPFGFNHVVESRFPGYDMKCASSGMWLDKTTFYIKTHILDTSCGSVHIELCFSETDVSGFIRKQEESLFQEYNLHCYGVLR